jgi:hypothetical protein
MEQDVQEARAAGAKGYSSVQDVQVGQEAALWMVGFALMAMVAVGVEVWAPCVTDAIVFLWR